MAMPGDGVGRILTCSSCIRCISSSRSKPSDAARLLEDMPGTSIISAEALLAAESEEDEEAEEDDDSAVGGLSEIMANAALMLKL